MSTPIDDGGAAFPCHGPNGAVFQYGITLRDWFAGQALAGITTQWNPIELYLANTGGFSASGVREFMVGAAYAQADAMIAERKGGNQ